MVVQALVSSPAESRTRLPEKGDIRFVPYKKIDVLYDLMERTLRQPGVEKELQVQLRTSQQKLVTALKQHFDEIKRDEMGLRSARVVVRSAF